MPTFQYEAMNTVGQPVKGEIDAASSEDAIAKLRSQGNFPTKIKEKAGKKGSKGQQKGGQQQRKGSGRRTAGAVPAKLLTQFTRQLSTLIDAGLPILRSLRILEEQQKPGMLRVAIRLVAEDVEAGLTLSEAMERHPKTFNRLYVNMVRAGELGGVLDLILQRLAEFQEKSQALKRKVVGAMIYPSAVITFALLIVTGLLVFVVPQFKTIFADMGSKLPGTTVALLSLSEWVMAGGWMVIMGLPVAIWLTLKLLKTSQGGRYFVDSMSLHLPLVGSILGRTSVARFTRTLGTLLSAGVPILEALNITRDTSGNEVYSRALTKVHDGIREGESFADPLRQARIVDSMVVNMIDVGEETGELDKMLNKVADTYDEEVETLVSSMTAMLEPVMVITLGLIVGFIVIALFMPMVGMLDALQGKK
ncbi:MAG: Type II secretion system protein F [Planctomycetes bacterium ADurb.Bin126]|nr:MAG: Type II secretion system protein F [Planctomycetes bacterium ADurb.Bin126]HOD80237.1 type II secretion system F family protein [Phycisphaerae bacterium]HQL72214.1 type II secretion system F family protein [Phycisphaerae bacterium]